jgi:formylglycine-generating enzyme
MQFGDFIRETGYVTGAERFSWPFVLDGFMSSVMKRPRRQCAGGDALVVPCAPRVLGQPQGPGSTMLERLDHPLVHVS